MNEEKPPTPAQTVAIAADEAAKVVRTASNEAAKVVAKAAEAAIETVDKEYYQEEKLGRILSEALREVFGEHEKSQRFVDVTRIPLICKAIVDMHENQKTMAVTLNKIQESLGTKLDDRFDKKYAPKLVQQIVFAAIAFLLTSCIGAVIGGIIYFAINAKVTH